MLIKAACKACFSLFPEGCVLQNGSGEGMHDHETPNLLTVGSDEVGATVKPVLQKMF